MSHDPDQDSAVATPCPAPQRLPWPLTLAILTAFFGLVITGVVTQRLRVNERNRAEEQFRQEAEALRTHTEQEIRLFLDVLNSIRALHGLSGEISADALEEFVELGMIHQQQILGAFGFAQRIGHAVRQSLEQAYEESATFGYQIVERGNDGELQSARQRPLYFPLTWESTEHGLGVPLGFDFGSIPAARTAIEQMQLIGGPAIVTEPVSHSAPAHESHWVFSPIFYRVERDTTPAVHILIGFAMGRIEPNMILQRVARLSRLAPRLTLSPTPMDPETVGIERADGDWIYRHAIEMADQSWVFSCRIPVALSYHPAWTALIAGLLVTLLMTSQMFLIANRTRRIENEVRARTRDLRDAKEQLEVQMQERMRLEEEMSDLAMRERQRLGRDLHDSLGQKLTGALMLSRALVRHFKASGLPQETHAHTLNDTLKESVGQVRSIAKGLAPVALNDESLIDALSHLAEEMTSLYGVSCEWIGPNEVFELDEKVKEQLYLIAREATNNAARHAHANRVWINLHQPAPNQWTLLIEDDGAGIPPDPAQGNGMGLRIMAHRARMIQATFQIQSRSPQGTTVSVAVRQRNAALPPS